MLETHKDFVAARVVAANASGTWYDSSHVHVILRNDNALRFQIEMPPPPVDDVSSTCPEQCPRNVYKPRARPIVAALKVRIYDSDAARISAYELIQWVQFHRLAGIDRIYLCDSFDSRFPHEAVLPYVWPLVRAGVIEYYNFSSFAPPFMVNPLIAQAHCYHLLLRGNESEMAWATTIDVDEYVVSPGDPKPGYIRRMLDALPESVMALMMENFIMHGVPDPNEELLINRVKQRAREPMQGLTKYFARPQRVLSYDVHRIALDPSDDVRMNRSALFFLHAWGSRAFGFDSKEMPSFLQMQMQESSESRLLAALLVECSRLCRPDEFHWLRKPGPPFWTALDPTTNDE